MAEKETKQKVRPNKKQPSKQRIVLWTILIGLFFLLLLLILILTGYIKQNVTYYETNLAKVKQANFTEKQVTIEGYKINYAEGPDNGVPLLLIHGQGSQWEDYMKVLPALSKNYHIFAIDMYGHGQSDRLPANEYTNVRVGTLIAKFMEQVVKEPAFVSGHSSGGLITIWIAANRPELVKGIILEDPPLFSSIMPRFQKTAGGDLAKVTHDFISQKKEKDFQKYYVQHSNYFSFFGSLEKSIIRYSVNYIAKHPGKPLELFFLPPNVNLFFQGLVHYDPVFGAAWYTNSWYKGFDTEMNLAAIQVPAVLIHANYWQTHHGSYYDKNGILMAAMDQKDVAKTKSLLKGLKVVNVDAGHLVHFEEPDEYIKIVTDFTAKIKP